MWISGSFTCDPSIFGSVVARIKRPYSSTMGRSSDRFGQTHGLNEMNLSRSAALRFASVSTSSRIPIRMFSVAFATRAEDGSTSSATSRPTTSAPYRSVKSVPHQERNRIGAVLPQRERAQQEATRCASPTHASRACSLTESRRATFRCGRRRACCWRRLRRRGVGQRISVCWRADRPTSAVCGSSYRISLLQIKKRGPRTKSASRACALSDGQSIRTTRITPESTPGYCEHGSIPAQEPLPGL